jgi:protein-tyrosine phosphatase
MHEVIHGLYIASFVEARTMALEAHYVFVNCTRDLPMLGPGIRIPVDDDLRQESIYNLYTALPNTMTWIEEKLRRGNSVVVHCAAGQQRSAATVGAYLIWKFGYSVDEAIQYLRRVKSDAFLNGANFRPALDQWSLQTSQVPR